jgi:FkbM family methyltransferase
VEITSLSALVRVADSTRPCPSLLRQRIEAVDWRAISKADLGASMQSFSQHGQDAFVYETFFKSRDGQGYFVDVGAYDGVTFSNSLFFERHLGWSGICIEPLPAAFEKLRGSRTAICLNCAVADRDGKGEFVDVDMPNYGKMYSGLRAEYDPRHVQILNAYMTGARLIEVPLRRLADILDENGVRTIDYMSIDTEGGELKILKSIDLKSYDVRVISVENNYEDPAVSDHLLGLGYRLIKTFAGFDELYAK